MVRILHIGMSNNPGGVENFIMNIYRKIDRSKIQFDFLVDHNVPKIAYEDEILSLGGNIYREYYRRKEILKFGRKSIKQFFKEHPEITAVHMHANTLNPMFKVVEVAKKCNIPVRILHSHNSGYMKKLKLKDRLYEKYAKLRIGAATTDLLACSDDAGKWMFKEKKYTVIKNSIDIEKYLYNNEKRQAIRKKIEIADDETLIGTVTRLNFQKNPMFLAKIFHELCNLNSKYKLLVIGDGELKGDMKYFFEQKQILQKVIFLGSVDNVSEYLSAMDIFIFPSRFEGFGIALLEAEVSGMKCYASDTVPMEIKCSENLTFISLEDDEKRWAEKINGEPLIYDREIDLKLFDKYSIEKNISEMEKIYMRK